LKGEVCLGIKGGHGVPQGSGSFFNIPLSRGGELRNLGVGKFNPLRVLIPRRALGSWGPPIFFFSPDRGV